jgi:hypothetical protein
MIRYRLFANFDKEEKWLTEMARQGWELSGIRFGGYHFNPAPPQDTCIRMDFHVFTTQAEFINYVTLYEDSGWQHLAGGKSAGAQYFKRVTPDSTDDIFSDALSRAERYRRYANMWLVLAVVLLVLLAAVSATGAVDLRAIIEPRRFYLTPGLWSREGDAFWQAFWFETPFALFRALMIYTFPLTLFLYLTYAALSMRQYRKEKNNNVAA